MANAQPEILLNKADVDRVFSFNKVQWKQGATQMITPGWDIRTHDHPDGTQVIGFEPTTGRGLSVQSFFRDDVSLPHMVIVGSYFPLGTLPPMTEQVKQEFRAVAQKEIGPAYSLNFRHSIVDKLELYEFTITKL